MIKTETIAITVGSLLILAGCGTVQHAEFNMPRIASSDIETEVNGTRLAFRLTEVCLEISESIPSAKFDNLAYGPAFAPFLPLGLLADGWPDPPYVGIYIYVDPRESDISFDPRLVRLLFNTGEIVTPTTIQGYHGRAALELKSGEEFEEWHTPIERFQLPVAVPYLFSIDLHYDEPQDDSIPVKMFIEGVFAGGSPVDVPEIYFEYVSTTRVLFSGSYINGSRTLDSGCEHFE